MSLMTLLAFAEGPSIPFVCFLGVGTVFVGLICIIGLMHILSFICDKLPKKSEEVKEETPKIAATNVIENRSEILAAVCAAVAEENGTDISAIRVISFKKVN